MNEKVNKRSLNEEVMNKIKKRYSNEEVMKQQSMKSLCEEGLNQQRRKRGKEVCGRISRRKDWILGLNYVFFSFYRMNSTTPINTTWIR